jgi:hypothetical protein
MLIRYTPKTQEGKDSIKTGKKQSDFMDYYYIHRHLEHFKKRDTAVILYMEQKEALYDEAKSRYAKHYLENINNKEALTFLNDSMSEEEIMSAVSTIDEKLKASLEKNITKEIPLTQIFSNAHKSMKDYLNSKNIQSLNTFFQCIQQATSVLEDNDRYILAPVLKAATDITALSDLSKVQQIINDYQNDTELVPIASKTVSSIIKSINGLVSGLEADDLQFNSASSFINNIFSTQVGEYFISKGVVNGYIKGEEAIKEAITKSLVGARSTRKEDLVGVEITNDGALAEYIDKYSQINGNTRFKVDNSFAGLEITEGKDTINVNLGISTKWYKRNKDNSISSVSITRESALNRINQMYNVNQREYVYNTLGLANQDAEGIQALKQAILARNIDLFLSGLGINGDFAQFIAIGNEMYSIWDIINAVEHYNTGAGTSEFSNINSQDPIVISFEGLQAITDKTQNALTEEANWIAAQKRSRDQNKLIKNLKIHGRFYPQRLKNILSNKNS